MGAKTLISPEEYLATHYEWEPEFVDGELRDRPMPTLMHSRLLARFIEIFFATLKNQGFRAAPDVRYRMPNGNYRLPDVVLLSPDAPIEDVPTFLPVVVIEVLSNDDKYNEVLEKLVDYESWRVPHIWVVNPRFKTLEVFEAGSLRRVEALTLPQLGVEIRYSDLLAGL